jgi:hypothetical protein
VGVIGTLEKAGIGILHSTLAGPLSLCLVESRTIVETLKRCRRLVHSAFKQLKHGIADPKVLLMIN